MKYMVSLFFIIKKSPGGIFGKNKIIRAHFISYNETLPNLRKFNDKNSEELFA